MRLGDDRPPASHARAWRPARASATPDRRFRRMPRAACPPVTARHPASMGSGCADMLSRYRSPFGDAATVAVGGARPTKKVDAR